MTRSYGSITGLKTDSLPWRLWEKAKRLQWNPADIDFGQDAEDWQKLSIEEQLTVGFLARTFMVGEEAVTLDILPLIKVMADQGKTEDTMFLTTFVFDEAKHVEFFRRFFDAVGFDPAVIDQLRQMDRASGAQSGGRSRGEVGGRIGARRIFDEELPRVMNRLSTDPSPEAMLDATLTYNQFVEGVLAIAGYRVWYRISGERGILPGMKEGLGYVQRDERRHIAYGTYLPRLIIAEHPELWDFVVQRLEALRDNAFPQLPPDEERQLPPLLDSANGAGMAMSTLSGFRDYARSLVGRRIEAMAVARNMRVEDVRSSSIDDEGKAEEEEEALEVSAESDLATP